MAGAGEAHVRKGGLLFITETNNDIEVPAILYIFAMFLASTPLSICISH